MTPNGVHFAAQLIRHHRGMMTAIETWMRYQPASVCGTCGTRVETADTPTIKELREVCYMLRQVLATYEEKLSAVVVEPTNGSGKAGIHSTDQPTRPEASRLERPIAPLVVTPRK